MPARPKRPARMAASLAIAAAISTACSNATAAPQLDSLPERLDLPAATDAVTLQCIAPDATDRTVRLERSFVETFDRYPEPSRWEPHFDGSYDWPVKRWLAGNKEQQIYVDRRYPGSGKAGLGIDPFSVADGRLTITGDKAPDAALPFLYGQRYTSGLLTTRRSFTQAYGYFEMRGRMPAGQGVWPAFWLLPENVKRPYPEIDIIEMKGREPMTVNQTVHYGEAGSDAHRYAACKQTVATATSEMHNYGALVEPDRITFYIDRVPVGTMAAPPTTDQKLYMLLNLALGGAYGGAIDATTQLPVRMQIDHVVAYRLATPAEAPRP